MFELLAVPQRGIPYGQMGFRIVNNKDSNNSVTYIDANNL
jgi:hypothetical protein